MIRPTANTRAFDRESPARSVAIGMYAIAISTAMMAISQATRRTWCSSGLSSVFTSSERAAIRPSSVLIPVARTTAVASPPAQLVPLNTRSRAWSSGRFTSVQAADRATGIDSPLSVDESTSSIPTNSRASAEIRSPSSKEEDVAEHKLRSFDRKLGSRRGQCRATRQHLSP